MGMILCIENGSTSICAIFITLQMLGSTLTVITALICEGMKCVLIITVISLLYSLCVIAVSAQALSEPEGVSDVWRFIMSCRFPLCTSP